jgi:hypothetical protein
MFMYIGFKYGFYQRRGKGGGEEGRVIYRKSEVDFIVIQSLKTTRSLNIQYITCTNYCIFNEFIIMIDCITIESIFEKNSL